MNVMTSYRAVWWTLRSTDIAETICWAPNPFLTNSSPGRYSLSSSSRTFGLLHPESAHCLVFFSQPSGEAGTQSLAPRELEEVLFAHELSHAPPVQVTKSLWTMCPWVSHHFKCICSITWLETFKFLHVGNLAHKNRVKYTFIYLYIHILWAVGLGSGWGNIEDRTHNLHP